MWEAEPPVARDNYASFAMPGWHLAGMASREAFVDAHRDLDQASVRLTPPGSLAADVEAPAERLARSGLLAVSLGAGRRLAGEFGKEPVVGHGAGEHREVLLH